tara:strand:+ start:413 stop:1054 length:642 start_codon:yes stop_codon:yes gene_type:complete
MAIAGMIFRAGKWIAHQSIKKRMATRAKMQKKHSKPATQKAKAQQAVKKHRAKLDSDKARLYKTTGTAKGKKTSVRAKKKTSRRNPTVSTDLYKSIKGYPTSISKAIGAKHIKAIRGRKATWADKNPKKAAAATYAGFGGAIYASHKAGFDPLAPLTRSVNKKRGTQSTKERISTKTRSVVRSKAAKKASKKSITQKRYRKVRANQLARKTRY